MKENIKFLSDLTPYGTNCYILPSLGILIDPGGEADYILPAIKDIRIKYIINTHGHIDHIMENERIRKETGALLLISEEDSLMLASPLLNLSEFFGKELGFKPPDRTIKNGDKIEDVLVVATPGHTPGSISLVWNNCIFCGDIIFSNGYGRTDLPGGSFKDLKNSIKKLLEFPDETILYPGHGDSLSIKEAKCQLMHLINL